MPVDPTALLAGLKPILKTLDADLLVRAKDPGVEAGLKVSWESEKTAGRTGDNFNLWKRRRCTQVGIAWVLSVVFVRTLEDRGFLARHRIAGPGAEDSERQFTTITPFLTTRDYLLTVFRELATLPGAGDLFDARHNPVWVLAPSADAAHGLLDFFRRTDAAGELLYRFDGADTRFLGDLYQNLSEDVRKRFALLQTPEFVEEFILEQTLDPAVQAFGLGEVRLIDPTCGSGHFLLGAFHRLFDAWQAEAPGKDVQELAQRALGQVHGCDLNPYAVAIARFRLTLEFLQSAGITRLSKAPRLSLNLCVADSLLHGVTRLKDEFGQQLRLSVVGEEKDKPGWHDNLFALEDEAEALRILKKRYHAVVGNPPYITEKDAKKREKYRDLYESASGQFALAAPFTQRFFDLAVPAGFVGLINANSFTKRDFGKALIEQVLPRLDVSKIVDTSGAYIPGHGTPTLLLFGRNRAAGSNDVVAVLSKRGESESPANPARAPVWSEIVLHHDEVGFDGRHVSVELVPREKMAQHPWALAGGGALSLFWRMASVGVNLDTLASAIGFAAITGEDSVFLVPRDAARRLGVSHVLPLGSGEMIRNWVFITDTVCVWPNSPQGDRLPPQDIQDVTTQFWPYRASLRSRRCFGVPVEKKGIPWWAVREVYKERFHTPLSIAFAFVATHNHFVLDRGGMVFKQSAPIIKLKEQYDEDDHLSLLGLLNSSVACFWMKMVFFDKGSSSGGTIRRESWEPFFEFDGTKLKKFPVASDPEVHTYSARLDMLSVERQDDTALSVVSGNKWADVKSLSVALTDRRSRDLRRLEQMVGLQEELDWLCYRLYGLADEIKVVPAEDAPRLRPGHRPFELDMALDVEPTDWFARHGWTPNDTMPSIYSEDYRSLVGERRRLIASNKSVQLVERPDFKRRWYNPDFDAQEKAALHSYLLDKIENLTETQPQPAAMSARQLAAELHRDPKAQAVAEVYTGESAPDLERLVSDLVNGEGVPYLAALRYTDTGLEKYAAWCETWDLQRREDAGEDVGEIPVPPKYATPDFRGSSFWTHRGKLDVPKERFVLYPGTETDNDSSPWLGWAGWDHLQRATALSGLYQQRKEEEGFEPDRLAPMLAGLQELVPWLIQWHNEPDANFGGLRLGHYFRDFVGGEAHGLGLSPADLEAWRPAAKKKARKTSRKQP